MAHPPPCALCCRAADKAIHHNGDMRNREIHKKELIPCVDIPGPDIRVLPCDSCAGPSSRPHLPGNILPDNTACSDNNNSHILPDKV